MTQPLPPLNWLRAFECAARHLSFTAAAGELSLTQSAVSQHVRALEQRLGTVLFVRKARGLALTNAGRQLLSSVSGALADLSAATARFLPESSDKKIKVACNWAFSLNWLTPRLSAFYLSHSDCSLQIISTLWPDDSHITDLDVEIRYGSKELVGADAELLVNDEIVLVCTPALAEQLSSLEKLYSLPLIQTVGTADNWRTWSESLKIAVPEVSVCSVDSYALTLALAKAGVGVALISRFIAQDSLASGELVIPLNFRLAAKDNHFLMIHRDKNQNPQVEVFARWLRNEISAFETS